MYFGCFFKKISHDFVNKREICHLGYEENAQTLTGSSKGRAICRWAVGTKTKLLAANKENQLKSQYSKEISFSQENLTKRFDFLQVLVRHHLPPQNPKKFSQKSSVVCENRVMKSILWGVKLKGFCFPRWGWKPLGF